MNDQFAHLPGEGRLEHRLDLIAHRVRHAVLPLFKPDGRRKPDSVGSSVAFESEVHFFLLTARHVVVDLKMNDFHIWTPDEWILVHGNIARTNPTGRAHDHLDAAVIRLDSEFVNDHIRRSALRGRDLDVAFPERSRQYLMQLIGYPGRQGAQCE
jgi:hypothetical protein